MDGLWERAGACPPRPSDLTGELHCPPYADSSGVLTCIGPSQLNKSPLCVFPSHTLEASGRVHTHTDGEKDISGMF